MAAGVELGQDPEVRRLYGKTTWEDDPLRAILSAWRASSLFGGLVVLVGAGGVERADRHVEETIRLIESLDLPEGAIVYLVDAAEVAGRPLAGMTPVVGPAYQEQLARFNSGIAGFRARLKAKVVPYSLEKQGL